MLWLDLAPKRHSTHSSCWVETNPNEAKTGAERAVQGRVPSSRSEMRSGDVSSFYLTKPEAWHERKSGIMDDSKAMHEVAHHMCHLMSGRRREGGGLGSSKAVAWFHEFIWRCTTKKQAPAEVSCYVWNSSTRTHTGLRPGPCWRLRPSPLTSFILERPDRMVPFITVTYGHFQL